PIRLVKAFRRADLLRSGPMRHSPDDAVSVLRAADVIAAWSASVMLDAGSALPPSSRTERRNPLRLVFWRPRPSYADRHRDRRSVEWSFDGRPAGKITFKGTLDGATKMKGTAEYGQLGKGTFTAEKK